jgi:hypothetical protein
MLNITNTKFSFIADNSLDENPAMREIAYSMDLLIPGLYLWLPGINIRLGGAVPDDQPYRYPGKIHSHVGIALVLPDYKIFTTYQGTYDSLGDEGNKIVITADHV